MRSFVLASLTFIAIFAASAVPIPLYADYQETIGLTTTDISNTMFTYLAGVSLILLLAGRISDHFGRKPITVLTLGFAILGCLLFMFAQNGASVLFARFIQGLSAGFGMSAVSSMVVQCAGDERLSWGSTVASCGAMLGVMLGSTLSGVLSLVIPNTALVYAVTIGFLAVCLVLLHFMPEPQTNPISLKAALRVSVYIPRDQFMLFVITAMCYLATWMVSCFFQSFSSTIAYDCFNDRTPLAGSVLLALTMAPSMLGGPLTARIPAKPTLVGGMVLVTFTTALMALCIINEWQIVFWVACFFNSLAMGACLGTSVRVLLLETNVRFVSAILSSINLIAYAGVAVIGLITGALLTATNYATTFAVMALVLVLCTFFVAHELKKAPNGEHSRILTAARIIKRYSRQLKPHAK